MLAATAMKAVDELEFAKGATKTGDRGTNSRKAQDALDELGLDSVLGSVALGRTDEVREVIAAKGEFTQHPDSVDYAFRAEKRGGPTSTALGGVEAQPKAASTRHLACARPSFRPVPHLRTRMSRWCHST